MPRKPQNNRKFKFLRTTGFALGFIFFLVLITVWSISIPKVQTWLVSQADWILEDRIGTEVELDEVNVALPAKIAFNGLRVKDEQGEMLADIQSMRLSMLNFSLWNYLFSPRDSVAEVGINGVEFNKPVIYVYKRPDSVFNYQYIIDSFRSKGSGKKPKPLAIRFSDLIVSDGIFTYVDSTSHKIDSTHKGRFIGQNFKFKELNLETSLLLLPKNQMEIDLGALSGREDYSGFQISFLSFHLKNQANPDIEDKNQLDIDRFRLRTYESSLNGSIRFPKMGLLELAKNRDKFYAEMNLKRGSVFDFNDSRYFLRGDFPLKGKVSVQGKSYFNRDQIITRDLILGTGKQTLIAGKVEVYNYNKPKRLKLNALFDKSRISLREVEELLPMLGLPDFLKPINKLELEGTVDGSLNDFNINLGMDTELGRIVANLDLLMLDNKKRLSYKGDILTENLNLNALGLEELAVSKKLNVKGSVEGEGIDLDNIDALLDLQVVNSDIKGYQLDTAAIDMKVSTGKIDGKLFFKDPEGLADVNMEIDLQASPSIYKIDGKVDKLNLKTYGIFKENVLASTRMHVDISGDSLDLMNGEISLRNAKILNTESGKSINVPELYFNASENSSNFKYLNLKSSLLDADIAGNFDYKRATDLLLRLGKETQLYFGNNDSLTQEYYKSKTYDSLDLKIQMGMAVKDSLNKVFDFFDVPLNIDPGSFVQGLFLMRANQESPGLAPVERLNINYSGGYIEYDKMVSYSPFAEMTIIKVPSENSFNMDGEIVSDSLRLADSFHLDELSIRANSTGKEVKSSVDFTQRESKGIASFSASTYLQTGGVIKTVLDSGSSLDIHGDTLAIDNNHSIVVKGNEINIDNLILQNDERYYRVNGWISENPLDKIELQFNSFDLTTINEFYPLDFDLEGILGGTITARSLLGKPLVELGARVSAFSFEDYDYGNIFTRAFWSADQNIVDLGTFLVDEKRDTTLKLIGSYRIDDEESPLDFKLLSDQGIPLNFFTPFVGRELYNLEGKIGLESFTITGTLDEPIALGTGSFEQASFGISYFQTSYIFNGSVLFDNKHINFQNIKVTDRFDNEAELYGDIRHKGFQEFKFNLQLASAKNFLLMETESRHNEYFYGTLILDEAIADITGDLETISVQALTSFAPGSELNIPADYKSEFNKPDYIVFKGEKDEELLKAKTELLGFDLNLTALASEDLDVNIIFDERVGDIIRAKGVGDINMILNEKGTFSIYGEYIIKEGDYLFTMENFINKRFKVIEGSKLTWDGDAFGGNIEITAVYETLADFSAIEPSNTSRIRTNVVMRMAGPLLQPQISLEIQFPGVNATTASSLVSYIKSVNEFDEQELNNQVFSLIVFNRFAPQGSLAGSDFGTLDVATNAVATSLSELLNNQLNYWVSRATGNKLNVNVNTGIDQNLQINDINLQVSAKLFGDRVKIERDGNLLEEYTADNIEGIIGNISLTVRLLPGKDGGKGQANPSELVLEVFGRQDILEIEENAYQTGVGLFYKKDLDKLSDLFKRKAKKEKAASKDSTQTGG
ncbi:MAG: translocation/assembly module TamB [Bacteroidia bacterium]|nr:translocation/assembly module TamB [Bacteroidia bacterium]